MIKFLSSILTVLIAGCLCKAIAQETTEQGIFHPDFATLQVSNLRNPYGPPVIVDGSGDKLIVSFDEFSDEIRRMRCSLLHCNADWQPSGLVDSEFLDGFNEAEVTDGEFSRATLTHYVHYTIEIPSEKLRPLLPGNYLLRVYDEMFPDKILIQARFSICSHELRVVADVSSRTDIDFMQSHQQLQIEVDASQSLVNNLYTDLKVIVNQNYRPDTEVTLTAPSSVRGKTAIYAHRSELIFGGGNEYRRMEIISTSWPGMGVDRMTSEPNGYVAWLQTDIPRHDKQYEYDQTQAGRFTIREYNSTHSDTQAEYITTLFTLESPKLEGVEVYLEGDLTGRKLDESSRMEYDAHAGAYVKDIFLKQGAYNYQYVARSTSGDKTSSTSLTEGNFHDTDNVYTIYVYYRRPNERFDRLAGVTMVKRQ